jgi:hypothetical protein
MPSPFPGMDPYLEDPAIWPGVLAAILAAIFERLGPAVRPRYLVRYEERVYVTSEEDPGFRMIVPDVRVVERAADERLQPRSESIAITEPIKLALADPEIHERRLNIIDAQDRSIVTVIELLSPTNKVPDSFGRESFLNKRREILASGAHWCEIDLLREGERTSYLPRVPETEYLVYLSRSGQRHQGYVWPISLRDRLPVIAIPLRGNDPDVPLDLQAVIATVIERGSYDLDADYSTETNPPLKADAVNWARGITAARRA